MTTKKILLVIPYLAAEAQGGELETAVNGWRKNFKGSLDIVVIGDDTPITKKLEAEDKIQHVLMSRGIDSNEPAIDIAHKMLSIIERYANDYKGCIWSNDDIYPVNPISLSDIKLLKTTGSELVGAEDSENHFKRNMFRTQVALQEAGKPIYNYSNHLPNWFDFERLFKIIDEFKCTEVPYLINSLYFNYYYPNEKSIRVNVNEPDNGYKYAVYGDLDVLTLRNEIERGVLFINNTQEGYSPGLILTIREYL